jgi:hypothetical protein
VVGSCHFNQSEMALSPSARIGTLKSCLTPPTLSERRCYDSHQGFAYLLVSNVRWADVKRNQEVSGMSLTRETPEPMEQDDAGNVRQPDSHSSIARKRITAALVLLLMVLVFTIHNYHRSTNLRGAVDWRWLLVGELPIAVLLVAVVIHVLRKRKPEIYR